MAEWPLENKEKANTRSAIPRMKTPRHVALCCVIISFYGRNKRCRRVKVRWSVKLLSSLSKGGREKPTIAIPRLMELQKVGQKLGA